VTDYRYPLARVSYGREEIEAVVETLEAGRTTMGPRVAEFERRFAEYVGATHAVMVNSGSSADLLLAFGLGPADEGDEVLVPAVTWPTQVWACVLAGYTVRLVDCDPSTLQFDADDLERKITPRTNALFPAHILGHVGNMHRLFDLSCEHNLPVIEDCCEALGAWWCNEHVGLLGARGAAGAFSFFFSHLLSTMEGGMVVTDDDEAARRYRLWRNHGWEPRDGEHFHFTAFGLNLRPMEVQGAFGLVQLGRLDAMRAARVTNHRRLTDALRWRVGSVLGRIGALDDCTPSWHAFPFMVAADAPFTKHQLCAHLEARGIETRPIVAGNLARQPAVAHHPKVIAGPLPGADQVHERGFYIGLANFDDPEGTGYVAQVLDDFIREHA
jgi:CDP-6-deoxy-D-xylo-4-hexulose-3-dehydrase